MIKFFRKIRQKLLDENRFSKYLLYALGEIILVVIGILIALQINNWNEQRKLQQIEKQLLNELETSLKSDLADVIYNIKRQTEIIASQNNFINWLEGSEQYKDSLSKDIQNTYFSTYFAAYEGPYETLKELGIRSIQNDSLRNQISKLYNITYPAYVKISDTYEDQLSEFLNVSGKHFNEITIFNPIKIYDTTRLKTDTDYLFKLRTLKNLGLFIVYGRMEQTKKEIEKTLELIRSYSAANKNTTP